MAENTDISNIFKKENNPIKKFANSLSEKLLAKAEDKLTGALSDALAKVGLGQGSGKSIASQLGDAIVADLAAEFFGALGKEINRATKDEIEQNRGTIDADADDPGTLEPEALGDKANVLRFPSTLNDYHMRLEIKKYERLNPKEVATAEVSDVIILPLPRTLEDRHEISYESNIDLGFPGAVAANGARTTSDLLGSATEAAFEAGVYGAQQFAGRLPFGNQIFSIMQQMAGAIPNPHISALFKSATLRRHRFDWLLAPNNPEESETLRLLLLRLKQASLPSFVGGHVNLLEMPEMIKIKLMPWAYEDENDYRNFTGEGAKIEKEINSKTNLFTFKHCMIENISVNYAPDSPTFFVGEDPNNPAPSFVLLSMSMLEIEYFTADDYGRSSYRKNYSEIVGDFLSKAEEQVLGVEPSVDPPAGANTAVTTEPGKNGQIVGTTERYVNSSGKYAWVTEDGKLISGTPNNVGEYSVIATGTISGSIASYFALLGYEKETNYTANTNFVYSSNGNGAKPTNK